ncbi:NodB-like proteiny domain-containing protein [Aphelenchoides fujianensis]|nr:NodB-like proteiny domain-containing protein [Aphelenchoides fujianensis]
MHAFKEFEHLGKKCEKPEDCDRGAACLFKTCACPPHTAANESEHCVPEEIERPPSLLDLPLPSVASFLTPIPSDDIGGLPGTPCGANRSCGMNAVCRPLNSTAHFCVCDQRLVTNATGHCTPKLLANTKKSLDRKCKCPEGTSEEEDGNCRYNPITVKPGSWCDQQLGVVCPPDAHCLRNVCVCALGLDETKEKCQTNQQAPALMIDLSPRTTQPPVHFAAPMATLSVVAERKADDQHPAAFPTDDDHQKAAPAAHHPTTDFRVDRAADRRSDSSVAASHDANFNQQRYRTHYSLQSRSDPSSALPDCPVDGDQCRLPSCFCSRTGADIPGGLAAAEIPQMVLISFDGPLVDRVINLLKALFDGRFRNPNRCPIGATLFATHVYSNYDQVQWTASNGFEIALSSMTGANMSTQHGRRWYEELNGMKAAVEKFSYANRSLIKGVRAPQFTTSGDSQFETMRHLGLTYDSSVLAEDGPFWPSTLDFRPPWSCANGQKCAQKAHPGVWELPVNAFVHEEQTFRLLSEATKAIVTPDELYEFLLENFERHVEANRAPFHLPLDKEFLLLIHDSGVLTALQRFLQTILAREYTYVVTMSQAVEWMKRPTRLQKLHSFADWSCRDGAPANRSANPSVCTFANTAEENRVSAHSFRVCGSCPNRYPWLRDPTGSGTNLY